MKENENKPAEGEAVQPSREEILAASRKENKNGDEMDVQNYRRGMQLAYSVGVILVGIVTIVHTILDGKMPVEIWAIYLGMQATWTLYYTIKSNKYKPLFIACAVISLIAFAFFAVYWILQLCGVLV